MAAVMSCKKLLNIYKIQYGRRFFVQQTRMAAVTPYTRLLNINNIQYGDRFFVRVNQYGDRDVMQKTT